jgi:hypothetical protein
VAVLVVGKDGKPPGERLKAPFLCKDDVSDTPRKKLVLAFIMPPKDAAVTSMLSGAPTASRSLATLSAASARCAITASLLDSAFGFFANSRRFPFGVWIPHRTDLSGAMYRAFSLHGSPVLPYLASHGASPQ